MADCLSQSELEGFLSGVLPDAEQVRAEQHMAICERCRKKLDSCRSDQRLFEGIRQAHLAETETASLEPAKPKRHRAKPKPTDIIEGYEILSEIHRGGQGVVYKAIQKTTKRTVALKVLIGGAHASARELHRFEREVDLIASLQHPHIVTIFDSGVTHDRRHYFAMEYIHGSSLDAHLSQDTLTIREKLHLFRKICEAVGHAHLRGVIHRDLKPSNIRVDVHGNPHLLDFGLAKTAGPGMLQGGTPVTITGMFMGTLAYASPEQTGGDPTLIDVRTDVYSLGVVLYEMLTNARPYATEGRMDEIIKTINEKEPKRPSLIDANVDDEVETIILKALAKEPDRRYQSATALAEDVERYLQGEPIEAKRASTMYMLRKTVRRHRGQIAGLAIVTIVLSFAAGLVANYVRDLNNRARANELIDQAAMHIERRENYPAAADLLDDAIGLAPDASHAYLHRGILNELRGLQAPLDQKEYFVSAALEDYEEAHTLAGGHWLSDLQEESGEDGAALELGSKAAVQRAARLRFLQGRHSEALGFYALAGRVVGTGADVDEVMTYDAAHDPLIRVPESKSPDDMRIEADKGAEVRRALREKPERLDPLKRLTYDGFQVVELLFDPLVYTDFQSNYRINDALVEHISPLNDELVSELIIRATARWHDGEPVTAADIAFSWHELPEDDLAKSVLRDVVALDSRRVAIHHAEPVADPAWDLSFAVAPKHVYQALRKQHADGEDISALFSASPVGNGPFRLVDQDEDTLTLQRWEEYPGERPYMKRVVFRVYTKRDDRMRALANGDVHVLELKPAEFVWDANGASLEASIVKLHGDQWCYDYICWNNSSQRGGFFDDPLVRRAMTMAFDTKEITQRRYGIRYATAVGIYHPRSWMANNAIKPIAYDPDEAAELLAQAGWGLADDRVRVKDGRRFEFSLLIAEESKDTRLLLTELETNLRAIGVILRMETLPNRELRERMVSGDFDAFVYGVIVAGHPDASRRRWISGGEANFAQYSDAKVDRLYQKARQEHDRGQRKRYYAEIQQIIYKAQPYTFLWHRPTLWAVHKNLRGIEIGPLGLTLSHPGPRKWWFPIKRD